MAQPSSESPMKYLVIALILGAVLYFAKQMGWVDEFKEMLGIFNSGF